MDNKKLIASLSFALGTCRGMLETIGNEHKDLSESIEDVLNKTSLGNLAKALCVEENEISIDWTDILSKEELDILRHISV